MARDRLPPLKSLEGFEAAARLGSFAAAAQELGLTQSAISHQVRNLEEALGHALFRRVYRQVVLTDAGRDFHRTVRDMLKVLRGGVSRLAPYRKANSVIVYADAGFAGCWLQPRLPRLMADLPGMDLWLDSRGLAVDFETTELDIFLTDAPDGGDTGLPSETLLGLDYAVYAAPALAGAAAGFLEGRGAVPLLHDEGPVDWAAWFAHFGFAMPGGDALIAGPTFTAMPALLGAAADGLGLALAAQGYAAPWVARGELVPVGDRIWLGAAQLTMVVRAKGRGDAHVHALADWLRAAAASGQPIDR
ncbi:LysR family glycine cleavage system transcriptional activator [Novosphingobium capsulatum]|uniref:LysR family glycine cleavage system transcriptional activator n=1 Tax=Novosphingobium capsulatum TaxID=13688 RepID=A0ABU1MS40_9SPHN|nr:LysR family transcriptional regulator [Novosphingobium capsulatum]MDR6512867.1 LysR family glycine cleavage system transcriptional activator [Novosphingobium capsulatum]